MIEKVKNILSDLENLFGKVDVNSIKEFFYQKQNPSNILLSGKFVLAKDILVIPKEDYTEFSFQLEVDNGKIITITNTENVQDLVFKSIGNFTNINFIRIRGLIFKTE